MEKACVKCVAKKQCVFRLSMTTLGRNKSKMRTDIEPNKSLTTKSGLTEWSEKTTKNDKSTYFSEKWMKDSYLEN